MEIISENPGPERGHSFSESGRVKRPCWQCTSEIEDLYSCSHCMAIQEFLKEADYFTCFAIGYRLNIDLGSLEEQYHNLSRKFHPDYYQQKSPEEQAISLENTALLNKAYQCLKDPQKRAAYLISLLDDDKTLPIEAPADLFEEIFEIQEDLEALKNASKSDTEDSSEVIQTLKGASERMQQYERTEEKKLLELFSEWDSLETAGEHRDLSEAQKACLTKIKQILSHAAYLNRIIQDIRGVV